MESEDNPTVNHEKTSSNAKRNFEELGNDELKRLKEGDTIFLTSKLDSNLYLYGDPCTEEAQFKAKCSDGDLPPDFEYCLWQVVPTQKYQQIKEFRRFKKQQKQTRLSGAHRRNARAKRIKHSPIHEDDAKKREEFLQKRVDVEREANAERLHYVIHEGKGEMVIYGQSLQLIHVKTGKYLIGSEEASSQQPNARKLYIRDYESTKTFFRILPSIKVRSEGNQVYYEDFVDLASTKYDGFSIDLARGNGAEEAHGSCCSHCPHDATLQSDDCALGIHLYARYTDDSSKFVQVGTPVQLYLHESAAVLGIEEEAIANSSGEPKGRQFQQQPVNKNQHPTSMKHGRQLSMKHVRQPSMTHGRRASVKFGRQADSKANFHLFEVPDACIEDPANFQGSATWVFDFPSKSQGGEVRWNSKVNLRHLPTGMYLGVELVGKPLKGKNLELRLFDKAKSTNESATKLEFLLEPVDEKGSASVFAPLGSNALIKHIVCTKNGKEEEYFLKWEECGGLVLNQEKRTERSGRLVLNQEKRTEDAFQIINVTAENAKMMEKICFYSGIAQSYVKDKLYHPKHSNKLTVVEKMLMQFIFDLVVGDQYEGEDDPEELDGPCLEFPQTFARHSGLIRDLMEMVYAPQKDGLVINVHKGENQKSFARVHRLAYRSLMLCLENPRNKEYFMTQETMDGTDFTTVIYDQIAYDCGATDCLNALVSNHFKLMDEFITDESIPYFISLIVQYGPRAGLMKFFCQICKCNGKPILDNQQVVLKSLLQNPKNRKAVLVEFHSSLCSELDEGLKFNENQEVQKKWDDVINVINRVNPDTNYLSKEDLKKPLQVYVSWACPQKNESCKVEGCLQRKESCKDEGQNLYHPECLGLKCAECANTQSLVKIEDLFAESAKQKEETNQFAEYLIAQVKMYAALCYGRCYEAIKTLEAMFPYPMLLSLSVNDELPASLLAAFNELMGGLWLDRHPHEKNCGRHNFPNLIWEYDELIKEVPEINRENALPDYQLVPSGFDIEEEDKKMDFLHHSNFGEASDFFSFPDAHKFEFLQKIIHNYLGQEEMKSQDIGQPEDNELTLAMLKNLAKLLSFGFYGDHNAIQELIGPLIQVLDGRDDKQEQEGNLPGKIPQRFIVDEKTIKVMDCKRTICIMLNEIRKLTTNYRLRKYLYWFCKNQLRSFGNTANGDYSVESFCDMNHDLDEGGRSHTEPYLKESDFERAFLHLFEESDDSSKLDIDALSSEKKNPVEDRRRRGEETGVFYPQGLNQKTEFVQNMISFFGKDEGIVELHFILLDLMMYQNDALFQSAFDLLYFLFSERATLQDSFKDAELVCSIKFPIYGSFKRLEYEIKCLRHHIDSYQTWLLDTSKQDSQKLKDIAQNKCKLICKILGKCKRFLRKKDDTDKSEIGAAKDDNINDHDTSKSSDDVDDDAEDDGTTVASDAKEDDIEDEVYEDLEQYHQNVLWNLGINVILLEILGIDKYADDLREAGRWEYSKLMIDEATQVLTYMIKDHDEIQPEVYEHMNLFIDILRRKFQSIKHEDVGPIPSLLVELFNDNEELCRKSPAPDLYEMMGTIAFMRKSGAVLKFFDNQIEPKSDVLLKNNQVRTVETLLSKECKGDIKILVKKCGKKRRFKQKLVRILADCARRNKEMTQVLQKSCPWKYVVKKLNRSLKKLNMEASQPLENIGSQSSTAPGYIPSESLISQLNITVPSRRKLVPSSTGVEQGFSSFDRRWSVASSVLDKSRSVANGDEKKIKNAHIRDVVGAWAVFLDEVFLKSKIKDFSCINSKEMFDLMSCLWDKVVNDPKDKEDMLTDYEFRTQVCSALRSFMKEGKVHDDPERLEKCLHFHDLCSMITHHVEIIIEEYRKQVKTLSVTQTQASWCAKRVRAFYKCTGKKQSLGTINENDSNLDEAGVQKQEKLQAKKTLLHHCDFVSALMQCLEDVYIQHNLHIEITHESVCDLMKTLIKLFPSDSPHHLQGFVLPKKEDVFEVRELSSDLMYSAGDLLEKLYRLLEDDQQQKKSPIAEFKRGCCHNIFPFEPSTVNTTDYQQILNDMEYACEVFKKWSNQDGGSISSHGINLYKKATETYQALDQKHAEFVLEFCKSKKIEHEIQKEKMKLIQLLMNSQKLSKMEIERLSRDDSHDPRDTYIITFQNIVERMAEFLANTYMEEDCQPTCLRIIEIAVLLVKKEKDFKSPDKESWLSNIGLAKVKPKMTEFLNIDIRQMISSAGFTKVMYDILCLRPTEELEKNAQELLKVLLENGNREVKQAVYLHASQNDKSGRFFKGFRNELLDGLEYLVKEREGDLGTVKTILDEQIEKCITVFELLTLCCSRFLPMQKALRSQQDFNRTSVDLVAYGAEFLEAFVKSNNELEVMNLNEIRLIQANLEFLIATCQGPCPENQLNVAASPAIMVCQMIITNEDFSHDVKESEQHAEQVLQATAIQLVATCLEGRRDKSVHQLLAKSLDDHQLRSSLKGLALGREGQKRKLTVTSVKTGLNVMSVWQFLTDVDLHMRKTYRRQLAGNDQHVKEIQEHLCYIEVNWDGKIEPALYELERFRAYRFFRDHKYTINFFSFSAALFLNLTIILHSKNSHETMDLTNITDDDLFAFSYFLGVVLLISFVALLTLNFLTTIKVVKGKIKREEKQLAEIENVSVSEQTKVWVKFLLKSGTASVGVYVLFVCTLFFARDRATVQGWAIAGAGLIFLLGLKSYRQGPIRGYHFKLTYDVLTTWEIVRYLLYIILLYVGFFFHSSFLSLLLLDVLNINANLQTVVQAITLPFRRMLSIFVLFCLSIVIFSSIGFYIFGEEYFCEDCNDNNDDDDESYCTNLWTCFLLFFNQGIRTGGDLGDIVSNLPGYGDSFYYANIVFLVIFFIVTGVLLFNMVTGVILDTFSSLREIENTKAEKLNNETFVAGLSRSYCQEKGVDFNTVNQHDQCVWNYLYFMLHLKLTDAVKYTGVEHYVSEMLKDSDPGWFPHFTSFSLVQAHAANSTGFNSTEEKMKLFMEKVERILFETESKPSLDNANS